MPAATSLLAATAALGGGVALLSAHQQSEALKAQAEFERDQAGMNAELAELQGEDAIKRGSLEANRALKTGRQVQGAQRAALAAQGIDVNSGSAAELLDETDAMAREDYETIKNNAWREAWGFKVQATNARGSGAMAYKAGQNKARNTMIIGGLNALSQFGQAGAQVSKGAKPKITNEEY